MHMAYLFSLLAQNCRGAVGADFVQEMWDIMRYYKHCVCFIMVMRKNAVDSVDIMAKFGVFGRKFISSNSVADGSWLGWDPNVVDGFTTVTHQYAI